MKSTLSTIALDRRKPTLWTTTLKTRCRRNLRCKSLSHNVALCAYINLSSTQHLHAIAAALRGKFSKIKAGSFRKGQNGMQLCVMAAMVFYFLLWRSKAKQHGDWAGRGRKPFNAVGGGGGGGRLTRSGLVDGVEDVCLEVTKQEA